MGSFVFINCFNVDIAGSYTVISAPVFVLQIQRSVSFTADINTDACKRKMSCA